MFVLAFFKTPSPKVCSIVMQLDLIRHIEKGLQQPLPGQQAHNIMAHAARDTRPPVPPSARKASVLALFYPKADNWHIVLIERTSHNPNDRHKGQISFPGGKHDDTDENLEYTALREANEEVGVDANQIKILGALSKLYIPVSNFNVHPFVGFMEHTPRFIPQESEVADILEVPFHHFTIPKTKQLTDIKISPQITLKGVPYFNIHNRVVWGATAMMMSELIEVVRLSQAHTNS